MDSAVLRGSLGFRFRLLLSSAVRLPHGFFLLSASGCFLVLAILLLSLDFVAALADADALVGELFILGLDLFLARWGVAAASGTVASC